MIPSLCEYCCHVTKVVSDKGSRFSLCNTSTTDGRFPKYPPQPVVKCVGFERSREEEHDSF